MNASRLIGLAATFASMTAYAGQDLVIGYIEYPPAIYSDGGVTPKGSMPEYIEKNIGKKFKITWTKIPIGRVEWAIRNNLIDAFPFLVRTRTREKYIYFPDKPLLTIQNYICGKKLFPNKSYTINEITQELYGSTLIRPLNSKFDYPFFHSNRINITYLPYGNYFQRSIKLLSLDRADEIIFPSIDRLKKELHGIGLHCIKAGKPVKLYMAIRKDFREKNQLVKILDSIKTLRY